MKKKTAKPVKALKDAFASRIVGEGVVEAKKLKRNPLNWRTHSDAQREAIREVLSKIGWVQKVVVNRRTGNLIDGHLRVEEARKKGGKVPVVYVDLTAAEERKMLALFDPLAGMAGIDENRLRAVLDGVEAESDGLKGLLDELRENVALPEGGGGGEPGTPGYDPSWDRFHVVLAFENETAVEVSLEGLDPPEGGAQRFGGANRVIDGAAFIRRIRGET